VIISGDSTDKRLQLINQIGPGSVRFFSIDGGHTAAHTLNDLQIANECISNEGIVILDDIMNPWWSGVIEGFVKFLQSSPTLVPVAMGHNKLYLSKISYQKYYTETFENLQLNGPKSYTNFFGHKILTFAYHSFVLVLICRYHKTLKLELNTSICDSKNLIMPAKTLRKCFVNFCPLQWKL
jgi:hypothetical protein